MWSLDNWQYLERQVVCDPKGRSWSVALMDVLGQEGDPEMPSAFLEREHTNRYFTIVYGSGGAIQRERGHVSLEDATRAYETLLAEIIEGSLDPLQPVFKQNLED